MYLREIKHGGVDWIELTADRQQLQAIVTNMAMDHREKFLGHVNNC
jgi:hypothetical protein